MALARRDREKVIALIAVIIWTLVILRVALGCFVGVMVRAAIFPVILFISYFFVDLVSRLWVTWVPGKSLI